MTTYTTLTISSAGVNAPLPTLDRIASIFAEHTNFSFDRLEQGEEPLHDGDDIIVVYSRRYTTEGLPRFAAALSAEHPALTVTFMEEWEARANRSHGGREQTYRAGRLASSRKIAWCPEVTLVTPSGVRFEHWTNGASVGIKVTRESDGRVEYLIVEPSVDPDAAPGSTSVFGYITSDPANDPGEAIGHAALFRTPE